MYLHGTPDTFILIMSWWTTKVRHQQQAKAEINNKRANKRQHVNVQRFQAAAVPKKKGLAPRRVIVCTPAEFSLNFGK